MPGSFCRTRRFMPAPCGSPGADVKWNFPAPPSRGSRILSQRRSAAKPQPKERDCGRRPSRSVFGVSRLLRLVLRTQPRSEIFAECDDFGRWHSFPGRFLPRMDTDSHGSERRGTMPDTNCANFRQFNSRQFAKFASRLYPCSSASSAVSTSEVGLKTLRLCVSRSRVNGVALKLRRAW